MTEFQVGPGFIRQLFAFVDAATSGMGGDQGRRDFDFVFRNDLRQDQPQHKQTQSEIHDGRCVFSVPAPLQSVQTIGTGVGAEAVFFALTDLPSLTEITADPD